MGSGESFVCVLPVHRAEGRERGLLGPRVPGRYVGQDFEEDFIGQVVCVRGHGKDAALKVLCGDYTIVIQKCCWVESLRARHG